MENLDTRDLFQPFCTSTFLEKKTIFQARDVSKDSFPCPMRRSWTRLFPIMS